MPKKLLLADDSVTIQKVVVLTFATPDYEVTVVGNGDEALARLQADPPDIVIADVHMPGASGLEVARQTKSLRPDLPVLLLVGTFEPFDEKDAEASGADGHLMKPFDTEELQRLVDEMTAAGRVSPPAPPTVAGVAAPDSASTPRGGAADGPPESAAVEAVEPAALSSRVELTPRQIEDIARRVAELVGDKVLRDVAWEVIPELAEGVVRDRLRELEAQVETADS